MLDQDRSDDEPFALETHQPKRRRESTARQGQQRFRLRALQRYGPFCAVSGITVAEMLDAAHIRGVGDGGSNDPGNALMLSGAHHRAYDANLFAIQPNTLEIVTRADGPTAAELGIRYASIRHLVKRPHPTALQWRWEHSEWS